MKPEIVKGSVIIGYVHPHTVTEGFARSLAQLCLWGHNKIIGITSASSPRQHVARNTVIRQFLDGPGEYLMWIDTDMTFRHDAIQQLLETARRRKADMVAGLAFIYKRQLSEVQPNCYRWDGRQNEFVAVDDYRPGEVLEVDGCGSAFVLIHRRVFEASGPHWHQNWMAHPVSGEQMGHDLAFFYDAVVTFGFRLVYDTNVKTGHVKHFELDEGKFREYRETIE